MAQKQARAKSKKQVDRPGPGVRALASLGAVVSRHPSIAGGTVAFAVVFSFISANALWYQPRAHPAPIFEMRPAIQSEVETSAVDDARTDGLTVDEILTSVPVRKVTTFTIQRQDPTETSSIPVPRPEARTPVADPVVSGIQRALAEKGYHEGVVDGLMGPRTSAAIDAYAKDEGISVSDYSLEAILDRLTRRAPEKRSESDIRSVIEAAHSGPVAAGEDAASVERVRKIQAGLSNIAYTDVTIDGIPGSQTRAAIRHFQKHYQMAETGEPSEAVLAKLVEIGAF